MYLYAWSCTAFIKGDKLQIFRPVTKLIVHHLDQFTIYAELVSKFALGK